MADDANPPLSVEEAKARLLDVAAEATPTAWVREHPWGAVGLAFAAGLLAGMEPERRTPVAGQLAQWITTGLTLAARLTDDGP